MISHSTIEKVKEANVLDVVREYVADLKKTGTTWRAKSPFKDEKTPSFYVVPRLNIFKDYSTGHGGDAVRFVMLKTGCSFVEAVEQIAKIINLRVEYDRPANDEEKATLDQREKLLGINQAAARRWAEALLRADAMFTDAATEELRHTDAWVPAMKAVPDRHPAFHSLVQRRGYTMATIVQWQLGYAPDGWQFMTDVLKEKALIAQGKQLGLVAEKNDRIYDIYRHRIIYPIHDHHGRIVAFGAGKLPRKDAPDDEAPKYINSPESPVWQKGKTLFGLHFAAHAIRQSGYAYLVEGYTDVISMHQAGLTCTVGTCGTALSEDQCKLLKRHADKVVLLPDPDDAGQRSALRNIDLLLAAGLEVHVVDLPTEVDGKPAKIDPDELTRLYPETPAPEAPAEPVKEDKPAPAKKKKSPKAKKQS